MDDQGNHLDSYTISLKSFRSFRGPLFRKPVTGQELFFAVSYSKPALVLEMNFLNEYGSPKVSLPTLMTLIATKAATALLSLEGNLDIW